MDASVTQSSVSGTTRPPASKSYSHRAILAAGYGSRAMIVDPLLSADTKATIRAVEAFGAEVTVIDGDLRVTGFDGQPAVPADIVDCSNSGTTMRLVTATASLADGLTVITGDDSLRSRPNGPLLDALEQLGGRAESSRGNGQAPIVIRGPIKGGEVMMPGDVSSQFVTALLMAGAVTMDGVTITLETDLKSAPYVDITRDVLAEFSVETAEKPDGFRVPGGQSYAVKDGDYRVPRDFSSISYLLAAGAIAADEGVTITHAYPTAQGDSAIIEILANMGGEVEWDQDRGVITVKRSELDGISVDVGDTPDLLPTIAVLGAVAEGTTRITNAEHVRYKETDRVAAMADELTELGVTIEELDDELVIHGGDSTLVGSTVDGRNDHRVIMSLAVAGLVAEGTTIITGAEHVDVSFPKFFDELFDLGARVSLDSSLERDQ